MSNFQNDLDSSSSARPESGSAETETTSTREARQQTIRECVKSSLSAYLDKVDHENISNLYDLVLSEVEAPLLETVLQHTRSNQSKASSMLGLNRGTLRKKLKKYGMLN